MVISIFQVHLYIVDIEVVDGVAVAVHHALPLGRHGPGQLLDQGYELRGLGPEVRLRLELHQSAGLPVHGQNTKTNARTRKGPKRMQVAGKKKAGKK